MRKIVEVLVLILLVIGLGSCKKEDVQIKSVSFLSDETFDYQIDVSNLADYQLHIVYDNGVSEDISLTPEMILSYEDSMFTTVGFQQITVSYEGFELHKSFRIYGNSLDLELVGIYEMAVTESEMTLSYAEWLETIAGEDGVGITDAYINNDGHLIIVYSDAEIVDVGLIVGQDGDNAPEYHVVNFYNVNGVIISSQLVVNGGTAIEFTPTLPAGYQFLNWIEDFSNITDDLNVYPEYEFDDTEYQYQIEGMEPDKYVVINGFTSSMSSIQIPSTIEGLPVYEIADDAFRNTNLVHIEVAENIKIIGYNAFADNPLLESISLPTTLKLTQDSAISNCPLLTDVSLPDNLETIGVGMFDNATSLEHIDLPDSLIEIRYYAFRNTGLTDIVFPSNLVTIGSNAFINSKLTTVTISEGVESIGNYAFGLISTLEEVNISSTVNTLSDYAFYGSNQLNSITVDEANLNYASVDGVLFNESMTKLIVYPPNKNETSYSVPPTVLSLAYTAFIENQYLETIAFRDDLQFLPGTSFQALDALKNIMLITSGNTPRYTTIDGVLFSADETILYKYPSNKVGTEYTLPTSVEWIEDSAFYNNQNLMTVTCNDGLLSIRYHAFHGAKNLNSITLSDTITTIFDHAFYDADAILEITLPPSIQIITTATFAEMDSLTTVNLNEGLTNISTDAFKNSVSLAELDFPESLHFFEYSAIENCQSLQAINVAIGNPYFNSIDGVLYSDDGWQMLLYPMGKTDTIFTVPEGVFTIEETAFYGNDNLETLILNATLVHEYSGFKNMPNLERIEVTKIMSVHFGIVQFHVFDVTSSPNAYIYVPKVDFQEYLMQQIYFETGDEWVKYRILPYDYS